MCLCLFFKVLSRANSALSEKVILQDNQQKETQSDLFSMKLELVEMSQNAEDRQSLTAHTLRGLEEKVQELSVQVIISVNNAPDNYPCAM